MNIFEALNEGKGKATLPEKSRYYVAMYVTDDFRYNFVWSNNFLRDVHDIELRSNDWIPYVPRGTCSNCGQAFPPQKEKHKEVFEGVRWGKDKASGIVYPYSGFDPFIYEKIKAKLTKMTLEWEE